MNEESARQEENFKQEMKKREKGFAIKIQEMEKMMTHMKSDMTRKDKAVESAKQETEELAKKLKRINETTIRKMEKELMEKNTDITVLKEMVDSTQKMVSAKGIEVSRLKMKEKRLMKTIDNLSHEGSNFKSSAGLGSNFGMSENHEKKSQFSKNESFPTLKKAQRATSKFSL